MNKLEHVVALEVNELGGAAGIGKAITDIRIS